MGHTIYQCFAEAATRHENATALMHRQQGRYHKITYRALKNAAEAVASGLQKLGIARGDAVAIFSDNRPEWAIADLAALKLGAIVVPIYQKSPAPCVKHILNDSKVKLLFVESLSLISEIEDRLPHLERVVLFDDSSQQSEVSGPPILSQPIVMSSLLPSPLRGGAGGGVQIPPTDLHSPVSSNDIATIVYTSGTTGEPKGVMLTHGNIVSNAFAAIQRFHVTSRDSTVSYLPLSHMFERTGGYYTFLFAGACIAYAENTTTVIADIKEIRPTILLAVPRAIEKVYDQVVEKVARSPFIKRKLVSSALRNLAQYPHLKNKKGKRFYGCKIKHGLYNMLVASKFRKIGGGKLRLLVSGGAPLNVHIGKILWILGFNIVEGYGLTETAPMVCCNTVKENRPGTVGRPLNGVEVKIGPNDEILARGPNVMRGYLNKPEDTARAIDPEGWFHTGDQGKFDEAGNLIITGRIKELIVTSYGKKIAPLPIEKKISGSKYIDQVMLYGDRRKCLVALLVPSKEALECRATDKDFEREIEERTCGLAPHEKIKAFARLPEGFTAENELLTPTLKLRRPQIAGRYAALIDTLYENLEKSHEH